ncbi:hypothetical protein TNCV_4644551 [Trichonephila clavipes]|nr:hypothetical protein TNCV_4644551 [Trichonephila clavipes]
MAQITPPAATANELWQRVEAALSAVPQEPIQSVFESMSRRVAASPDLESGSRFSFQILKWYNELVPNLEIVITDDPDQDNGIKF